jgi:NAD-dependent histone deacetylase SIR2
VPGKEIEDDVLNQKVPLCAVCNAPAVPAIPAKKAAKRKKGRKEWEESESEDDHLPPSQYPPGIMKVHSVLCSVLLCHLYNTLDGTLQPDITFFGEKLDDSFEKSLQEDRDQVDLLLVIGTSLKVAPVADILCEFCDPYYITMGAST